MTDQTTQYTETIDQLRTCYNTHAQKFSSTRKKHRPEFERIADKLQVTSKKLQVDDQINNNSKSIIRNSSISIIELWCGDWRLFGYLNEQWIQIKKYIGIDIADNFITTAKKTYSDSKNASWSIDDMIHGLSWQKDESADCIICVASFHHLPNSKTRELLLQQVYRVLKYGGKFITIDRSWSFWMLKKHRKPLYKAVRSSLLSAWRNERDNLMIPFTSNKPQAKSKKLQATPLETHNSKPETHHRLYHIFSRKELALLFKTHGFIEEEMIYSSQSGDFHHQRSQARNICTLVSKNIFVKNENKVNNNKNLHSSS